MGVLKIDDLQGLGLQFASPTPHLQSAFRTSQLQLAPWEVRGQTVARVADPTALMRQLQTAFVTGQGEVDVRQGSMHLPTFYRAAPLQQYGIDPFQQQQWWARSQQASYPWFYRGQQAGNP